MAVKTSNLTEDKPATWQDLHEPFALAVEAIAQTRNLTGLALDLLREREDIKDIEDKRADTSEVLKELNSMVAILTEIKPKIQREGEVALNELQESLNISSVILDVTNNASRLVQSKLGWMENVK